MQNIKQHIVCVVLLLAAVGVLAYGYFWLYAPQKSYSLTDLGAAALISSDCSVAKDDAGTGYPVTISFNAADVVGMREKIKALAEKYKGQISSDSFSSYPYENYSMDSANITVSFEKSQKEFLDELATLVKASGAKDNNYSFQDNAQQYGYSPFTTCSNFLQNVMTDKLQLEIFTQAMRREHNPKNISLISQSVSTTHTNLQNDVNALNEFFKTAGKPAVNIIINSPSPEQNMNSSGRMGG